jgi:hypothetical protein
MIGAEGKVKSPANFNFIPTFDSPGQFDVGVMSD